MERLMAKKKAPTTSRESKMLRDLESLDPEAAEELKRIEERIGIRGLKTGVWSDTEKIAAIMMYVNGKTNKEIGRYLRRGERTISSFLNSLFKAMANTKQSRILASNYHTSQDPTKMTKAQQKELERLKSPEMLNEPFYKLLSKDHPNAPLTDHEVNFCWALVSSDNYEEAIEVAGLDAGLYNPKKMTGTRSFTTTGKAPIEGYKHCLMLRATYLKRKSNIQKFIAELRKEAVYEAELDKEYVQKQIQIQIDQLRGVKSVEAAKLVKEYLVMLGKTVGGFTDKLDLGVIDHSKSLERIHRTVEQEPNMTETLADAIARKQAVRKKAEEAADVPDTVQ
jgi:hypothetical protein